MTTIGTGDAMMMMIVCFGRTSAEDARSVAKAESKSKSRVIRVLPKSARGRSERVVEDDDDDAYEWYADVKSAKEMRVLRDAVAKEARGTNCERVVVVARSEFLNSGEMTRATQLFLAFRALFEDGVAVSIALGRGEPPKRTSCLNANLLFNFVTAKCPARRLFPSRRARAQTEAYDEDVDDVDAYASRVWLEEHARAIESVADEVTVDEDCLFASSVKQWKTDEDAIQRLSLTMAEQLDDVSDKVRTHVRDSITLEGQSLRDGTLVNLVESTAERWTDGGYARLHYVASPPGPHGVYYELELADASKERIGYVAFSALQSGDQVTASSQYPFSSPDTVFTTAQVDRLCVTPRHRRRGVKELLLRAPCEAFHSLGLPVRIKTAKESVVASFTSCELLVFERVKDPSARGVAKRRGTKRSVVLPRLDDYQPMDRWKNDDDDDRDYSNWTMRAKDDESQPMSTATALGSLPNRKKSNPLSDFTAALNRASPDNLHRIVATLKETLSSDGIDVEMFSKKFIDVATPQTSYHATFAECCASLPEDFQSSARRRAFELLKESSSQSLVELGDFIVELWRRKVVSDDELVETFYANFHAGEITNEKLEVGLRAVLRFGQRVHDLIDASDFAQIIGPGGREAMLERGIPRRLIFLAEETHEFIQGGFQSRRQGGDGHGAMRTFGGAAPASTRDDAHKSVQREMKSLTVTYTDDAEEIAAASARGERKGWVFWYKGPITSHARDSLGEMYVFAGSRAEERKDDAESKRDEPRFVPLASDERRARY